jgi:hypothetical protein
MLYKCKQGVVAGTADIGRPAWRVTPCGDLVIS